MMNQVLIRSLGYSRLFICALLVFGNICLLTAILVIEPSDKACVTSQTSWSPLLDTIHYHWTTYSEVGFLIRSKYLGTPTAEVEAAWDDLFPGKPELMPELHRNSFGLLFEQQTQSRSPWEECQNLGSSYISICCAAGTIMF